MSDEKQRQEGGGGRRRRRRRRRGKGGGGNNQNSNNNQGRRKKSNRGGGGGGGGGGNRRRSGGGKRKGPKREQFGGREPVAEVEADHSTLELNAFNLFCTFHLGITADNRYKKPHVRDVAKRFNRSIDEIHDALKECGMDKGTLKEVGYDMQYAQLDVRVAPEGIDKTELAKGLFEEFQAENPKFVDWSEPEEEEDSDADWDEDDDYDDDDYDDNDYDDDDYEDSEE